MPSWFSKRSRKENEPPLATTIGAGALWLRDLLLREMNPEGVTRKTAWMVAAESLAFLLHVIDRQAFRVAGPFARQTLLDEITPSAIGQMITLDWPNELDDVRSEAYDVAFGTIAAANNAFLAHKFLWGDEKKEFNPNTLNNVLGESYRRIVQLVGRDPDFWVHRQYAFSTATIVTETDILGRTSQAVASYRSAEPD